MVMVVFVYAEKVHDIVKSREHGGECRKCGLKGTWDFIKSSPCQATKANSSISPPKTNASEVKVTSPPAASLGDQLDLALKNEDEQTAWEIVRENGSGSSRTVFTRSTTDGRIDGTRTRDA